MMKFIGGIIIGLMLFVASFVVGLIIFGAVNSLI